MANLYVSEEYKTKIINLLYESDDFIKLIDPTPSECPDIDIIDVLNGGEWIIDGKKWTEQGYVFDYNFVNDTTDEQRTFVFVETDIESVRNNLFLDFNLYVCIFAYKDLVRLTTTSTPTAQEVKDMGYFATSTHGNRISALCDCVDRILNANEEIKGIGTVNPAEQSYMTIYTPNSNYYGKCLRYTITNYNAGSDSCGD